MSEDIISMLRENVIQGRKTRDDEGVDEKPKDIARSWYDVILMMADEDVLKMDAVTDLPLKQALNFMAWKKEKTLKEQQEILKQKREYDLQRNRR